MSLGQGSTKLETADVCRGKSLEALDLEFVSQLGLAQTAVD